MVREVEVAAVISPERQRELTTKAASELRFRSLPREHTGPLSAQGPASFSTPFFWGKSPRAWRGRNRHLNALEPAGAQFFPLQQLGIRRCPNRVVTATEQRGHPTSPPVPTPASPSPALPSPCQGESWQHTMVRNVTGIHVKPAIL